MLCILGLLPKLRCQSPDEGAKHLTGLAGLRRITITEGRLTPTGLDHLKQLPKLEVVLLNGERVFTRPSAKEGR